jgi:hypothetical protein
MFKFIGKMFGVTTVLLINYFFWCYVEQTLIQENWNYISRFLFMTANAYILFQTIINTNDEN